MTENVPMVYIVIPVYNRIADTIRCIDSLMKQDYPEYSIILCDDGSTDGTSHIVRRQYSNVIILGGNGNLWWSGATNMGIKYALKQCKRDDLVLTLNNDVVVNSNHLSAIVNAHNRHPEALIGSITVSINEPEKIAFAGNKWNKFLAKWRPRIAQTTFLENIKQETIESDALPGRGMLIPAHVFREIGLFDEKHMPQYGADYDFSLRAKSYGYELLISTKSIVHADIDNKGYNSYLRDVTLKSFFISHFSRKSPRNFFSRFWIGVKHVPWFFLPIYFVLDEVRVTGSFFRAWFANKFFRSSI